MPLDGIVEWRDTVKGVVPYYDGDEAAWAPQPGSQEAFLECTVFECLYTGTRGPGKTDAILMAFARHVGEGYGSHWNGVIFRRTFPELDDIIQKSRRWFPLIFPKAKYNVGNHTWTFPDGEILRFRHFKNEQDYWSHHGHNYTFIGWEELTTWPDDKGYRKMMSLCRSTVPGIPAMVRSTTNPYGVGHNWVKKRFRLPITGHPYLGPLITDSRDQNGDLEEPRVAIHGRLAENVILMKADPNYIRRLKGAARNNHEYKAWIDGDWNIVAGGMFDDLWETNVHVLPNFPVNMVPKHWTLKRAYDHGSSHPFSVGWWAISNGEPFVYRDPATGITTTYGPIKGDTIRVDEWYGCHSHEMNTGLKMVTSKIAKGILDREDDNGIKGRVEKGPADSQIFAINPDLEHKSIAGEFKHHGVTWLETDKSSGSRIQGWSYMRSMLEAANPESGYREEPGLYVLARCQHFVETVPVLPRDEKKPDDVDTDAEDHIGDETRYVLRERSVKVKQGKM